MMRTTKTFHVEAAPQAVLEALLDTTVNPEDLTMASVYETPGIEGSTYEWSFKWAGLRQRGTMIVTEYVPGERVCFRNFGAIESTSSMTFEPENGGTKVTLDATAQLTLPLIGRFLDPILEREMLKNTEWTLRQVEKREAEKGALAS